MPNWNPLCPFCKAENTVSIEFCRRCGGHLLLLNKIQNEAAHLKSQNKEVQANALHTP